MSSSCVLLTYIDKKDSCRSLFWQMFRLTNNCETATCLLLNAICCIDHYDVKIKTAIAYVFGHQVHFIIVNDVKNMTSSWWTLLSFNVQMISSSETFSSFVKNHKTSKISSLGCLSLSLSVFPFIHHIAFRCWLPIFDYCSSPIPF